jgi:hypothetical protein
MLWQGGDPFFVYISGGTHQFLHVFQGGARRFLTVIFNVWPHTYPITIASSLIQKPLKPQKGVFFRVIPEKKIPSRLLIICIDEVYREWKYVEPEK